MANYGVMNWNDIRKSLETELGETNMYGWVDVIDLGMEQMRAEFDDDSDLPKIVQIKKEWGSLRIHTDGTESLLARQMLDKIIREVDCTCERCGNTAQPQQIRFHVSALCSHCYNRILNEHHKDSGGYSADYDLDIAESYPDLVASSCASMRPSIGRGWFAILDRRLQEMEQAILKADLPLGTVQISDIKAKHGQISINYHTYHECVALAEMGLELDTNKTCAICGHVGGRNRGKHEFLTLCDHCLIQEMKSPKRNRGAQLVGYVHPASRNSVPMPTAAELMTYHLGPLITGIAHEMREWHPLVIIDNILVRDEAEPSVPISVRQLTG